MKKIVVAILLIGLSSGCMVREYAVFFPNVKTKRCFSLCNMRVLSCEAQCDPAIWNGITHAACMNGCAKITKACCNQCGATCTIKKQIVENGDDDIIG